MRYFVVAPDGSKYGPAEIGLLKEWTAQGRIAPSTMLVEESTQRTVTAASLGLFPEGPFAAHPRREGPTPQFRRDTGSTDIAWSYFYSAMTLICCLLFAVGGFVYAQKAAAKGHPGALAAKVVAVICLILWFTLTGIELVLLDQIKKMAGL